MKNRHHRRKDIVSIFIVRRNGEEIEAKIDAEDLIKVYGYRSWGIQSGRGGFRYVVSTKSASSATFLHRLIMNVPDNKICIFLNNDTFDCRKENLKIVERGAASKASRKRDYSMRYIQKYTTKEGEDRYLVSLNRDYSGTFKTLEEAKVRRDEAVKLRDEKKPNE